MSMSMTMSRRGLTWSSAAQEGNASCDQAGASADGREWRTGAADDAAWKHATHGGCNPWDPQAGGGRLAGIYVALLSGRGGGAGRIVPVSRSRASRRGSKEGTAAGQVAR